MITTKERMTKILEADGLTDERIAAMPADARSGIMLLMVSRMAIEHITALLIAIDVWAEDEEGVHPDAFDAYESAREFIGQPLPPNLDDECNVTYSATKPVMDFEDVLKRTI